MPAAARVGDMTAHGTPLGPGPGAVNVLIGGQPAWLTVVDTHVCPLSTGPVAHAKGTVLVGSKTVYICGQPAARMGDQIVESGPPNTIAAGFPNVLIGG